MPLMVLTASSMRLVISVSISSAEAPGLTTVTMTVGKSIFGNQIDAQVKKEKHPTTISARISMVAKTGRLYAQCGEFMHGLASFVPAGVRGADAS